VNDPSAAQVTHANLLDTARVALSAALLDDVERLRKAAGSRHGATTGYTPDGKAWVSERDNPPAPRLDIDDPHVLAWVEVLNTVALVEKAAVRNLEEAVGGRRARDPGIGVNGAVPAHLMGPWIRGQKGLGLKQMGRLLAAVGDPFWRPEMTYRDDGEKVVKVIPEGPRTVSALWAYAGMHVVTDDEGSPKAARRRKGVRANWSTQAKTRAWLCATSCLKQIRKPCTTSGVDGLWTPDHVRAADGGPCGCSPYRVVYDERRAVTSRHRPDWTDGHRHNDALRVAAKEILKALWIEARRLHLEFDPELAEQFRISQGVDVGAVTMHAPVADENTETDIDTPPGPAE
jgi:hypothetical protein